MKTSLITLAGICLIAFAAKAQPQMVADIYPGSPGSGPQGLTVLNGLLYFSASKPDSLLPGTGNTENELWVSDGTGAGTQKVIDLLPGSQEGSLGPRQITRVGNRLFFVGHTNLYGYELWVSDGTRNGTHMVKNLYPYGEDAFAFGGTSQSLIAYHDKVIFIARDSSGYGVFSSDGTDAGTTKLISAGMGSGYVNYAVLNDWLYIHSGDYKLIRTNGTPEQTSVVLQTNMYFTSNMTVLNQAIYFLGDRTGSNFELWKTDGTDAGTTLVKEIMPGTNGCTQELTPMMASGNTLYFYADEGVNGRELWKSDGTAAGTTLLKSFTAGNNGTTFSNGPVMAVGNNRVIFSVQDPSGYPYTLWSTDGTETGTIEIADSCMGPAAYATNYHYTSNKLLISESFKIIATDGTPEGTEVIASKAEGTGAFNLLTYGDNMIYCTIYEPATGEELWKIPYQGGTTGLSRVAADAGIRAYPNPCHDQLTIDLGETIRGELIVQDLTGKCLHKETTQARLSHIDMSGWQKGLYFYSIRTSDHRLLTGKVILQ